MNAKNSEKHRFEDYAAQYLKETSEIAAAVEREAVARAALMLSELKRRGGRLFILGVGGSAANASHAVNDFRKISGIETYAPSDNVAELTARTNDDGWETVFVNWLKLSRLSRDDALLILSVGGGSKNASMNLVHAMEYARVIRCSIMAIVGRSGGKAKELSDVAILVPAVSDERVTPHTEGWQAIILHLLANCI